MTRSAPHPRNYLFNWLGQVNQALSSISQRQTLTITDDSRTTTDSETGISTPGPTVMAIGQIPNGMPTATPFWESAAHPLYGHAVYNKDTGAVVGHYGSQPDGSHGLWAYDSNQNPRFKVGEIIESGSTYYGAASYDASGNLRAQLGELPSGDSGLLVQDTQTVPVTREVLPLYSGYYEGTLSTSSSTPVELAGAPSFTVMIGQSGDAKINVSAFIGLPAVSSEGQIYLHVDSSTSEEAFAAVSSSNGGDIAASAASIRPLSQTSIGSLSPGSHTFTLRFSSSSGTCNFSAIGLVVEPI